MKYNTRTIKILEREKRKKIPLSIDETKYFSGRRKRGWGRDERKMHEERKPRRAQIETIVEEKQERLIMNGCNVYSCVLLVWLLVRTTGDWIDTLRAA